MTSAGDAVLCVKWTAPDFRDDAKRSLHAPSCIILQVDRRNHKGYFTGEGEVIMLEHTHDDLTPIGTNRATGCSVVGFKLV